MTAGSYDTESVFVSLLKCSLSPSVHSFLPIKSNNIEESFILVSQLSAWWEGTVEFLVMGA